MEFIRGLMANRNFIHGTMAMSELKLNVGSITLPFWRPMSQNLAWFFISTIFSSRGLADLSNAAFLSDRFQNNTDTCSRRSSVLFLLVTAKRPEHSLHIAASISKTTKAYFLKKKEFDQFNCISNNQYLHQQTFRSCSALTTVLCILCPSWEGTPLVF